LGNQEGTRKSGMGFTLQTLLLSWLPHSKIPGDLKLKPLK